MRRDLNNAPQPSDAALPPGGANTTAEPSVDRVRAALAAVLTSEAFAGAPRQQRLLKHLVEKSLGGAVGELKEYTLGVEVFDRGEGFDSRLDPIVRVEASRLRSRLQKYYESTGASDSVRISLPRGAYIPSFTTWEAPVEAAPIPATDFPAKIALPAPSNSLGPQAPEIHERHLPLAAKLGLGLSAIVLVTVIFLTVRRPESAAAAPDFLKFRRLTSDIAACTGPTFSSDGRTVAYARREGEHWQIYTKDVIGLYAKLMTPGSSDDNTQPAWEPNGQRIAFRSERAGGGLFLLDTRTLAVSRITQTGYHPAWSPDGKTIAFSTGTFREPGESYLGQPSSIQLLDVATGKLARLDDPDLLPDALQPAWSPDGKRIAYWSTDNGERDIWTAEVQQGSGAPVRPVRVTHDSWTNWSPVWSPGGDYLYFSSDRGGAMNLWRVRLDRQTGKPLTAPEPVTTPSSYSGWMSFAPDGKEFAYVHRLVSSQLYRAPFSVEKGILIGDRQQLTAGERIVREPNASPDGKWLVVRVQDPQEDLALIHPDGTEFHRITNDTFADRRPQWSPDGRRIIFLSNRADSVQFDLWSIHPDGTSFKRLTRQGAVSYAWTPDGTLVAYPATGKPYSLDNPAEALATSTLPSVFRPLAWSPDGKSVVGRMQSNAFGQESLFIFTPESSDFWQIAANAPYTSPVWLQDSRHLLFSRDEGIYLADIARHTLTPEPIRLPGQAHSRFAASPDGSAVYFVVSDDEEDIWLGSE